jgi:CHAT domain-containing protein
MSDATGAEPLASVRRELARLLVIYPRAILVENDELTKTRWVQAAVMSRTVHFAGHALSNSRNPRYSALLLSDQSSSDNALYAFEISRLRFKRTAVVVLNACATGAAAESLGNNSANVATAFLNAGVPSVIANLWPVRDGDSEALIVELHARMKAGISTASALRGAQLKVIEQTSPSVWAALEVMGADSN